MGHPRSGSGKKTERLSQAPQAFDSAMDRSTVGAPSFRVLCERVGNTNPDREI